MTRICEGANVRARALVMLSSAALEAAYAIEEPWPVREEALLMLTIDPPPAASRYGLQARTYSPHF